MQTPSLVMASYQQGLQRAMDVIANNVANTNTTGYKRQGLVFDTLVERPAIDQKIDFAVDKATFRSTAQGPMVTTGNPLDLAIQGKGYFQIETKEGVRYSRAGSFMMNNAGEVVTATGNRLLGDGGQAIVLPNDAQDIHVSSDGVVAARVGNAAEASNFGRVQTFNFKREQEMVAEGNGLYSTKETPVPDTESAIVQGSLERSNVDTVRELTQMIEVSRTYQRVGRLLEQDSQRRTDAINKLGRVSA